MRNKAILLYYPPPHQLTPNFRAKHKKRDPFICETNPFLCLQKKIRKSETNPFCYMLMDMYSRHPCEGRDPLAQCIERFLLPACRGDDLRRNNKRRRNQDGTEALQGGQFSSRPFHVALHGFTGPCRRSPG